MTTPDVVADFLTTTGFILEMEVGEQFKSKGYDVSVNQYFFDYEDTKKREIDIVASKQVNEINLVFVVECKQSFTHDWIFVCTDKSPSRYYNYINFHPDPPYKSSPHETKIFNGLRALDHNLPLAQNSTIRDANGKRSDSREIYECIMKLPKAVVGTAHDIGLNDEKRLMLVPLVVFGGQLFVAKYNNELKVSEVKTVQYETVLDSDPYTYHWDVSGYGGSISLLSDNEEKPERKKNSPVAKVCNELGKNYLIEFASKEGLVSLLDDIEQRVSQVELKHWPVKEKSASSTDIPF